MKLRFVIGQLILLALIAAGCKGEDPTITTAAVGVWYGETMDIRVNPTGIIPAFNIAENQLPITLEFKGDGSAILTTEDGDTHTGTYQQNGNKLTLNVNYKFEMIELSGDYKILELTNTTLVAETEREGSYTHPDTGQEFDGKVKGTFHFSKIKN